MGGLYKILAKVLANRLKTIIRKVISPTQNAFLGGRPILDAALITNEGVDSWLRRKESGLLCKLDIAKAYDHISLDFILTVLERMGFGSRWLQWIIWCISIATFLVLVNGSPVGFFRSSTDLRQGYPLSPFLFVIGMEVFSRLIGRAMEGNFLSGCIIGGRGEEGLVHICCMLMIL